MNRLEIRYRIVKFLTQICPIQIQELKILTLAELAELAKYQILKQAGQAMLTQANAIPNQVLGLLQ